MSTNSGIQWCTHTFNPWHGCTKVHAGCKSCYAEALDKRFGPTHWGNNARRMVLGEWGKPAKWNAVAIAENEIHGVFCASMCDLFEDYHGQFVNQQGDTLYIQSGKDGERVTHVPTAAPVKIAWLRGRVFGIIENTPQLRWLLLTKRPENITRMVPPEWLEKWPTNAWTGTSPCDQETADACIPNLVRVPGPHFLSCEPLVGPIDLHDAFYRARLGPQDPYKRRFTHPESGVHWVIAGGESGHHARPCDVAWLRSLRDQCKVAGVPFFLKQLGASAEMTFEEWNRHTGGGAGGSDDFKLHFVGSMCGVWRTHDRKGGDMAEWPEDLRVREVP